MAWVAGIGVAIAGAFGATIAATGITAMVVGGLVVGAAVGGLYSAITGGSILKGVLYGAVGGAVIGAGGAALGFGGASTGVSGAGVTGGIGAVGNTEVGILSATYGAEASVTGGVGGLVAKTGGLGASLFTKDGIGAVGAVASLGQGFLKGGLDSDFEYAKIESNEKLTEADLDARKEMNRRDNDTALAVAGMQAESAAGARESQEKMAAAELAFGKEKFSKEFEESQWRDRNDRETAETAKKKFAEGITEASKYVAGSTQVVNLVESNRRRKELPSPSWYDRNAASTTQTAQTPAAAQAPAQATTQPTAQPTGILGA